VSALSAAIAGLACAAVSSVAAAPAASAIHNPPPGARFSYQIGGAFPPAQGVTVVDRDWHDPPAAGRYSICYVNAFQAQPEALGWWRAHHRNVLLYARGQPVVDESWNEQLFDTSTATKRAELAAVVGRWIARCARAGYHAVEPDNLDSWSRSRGRLTRAQNLALARLLIRRAHRDGLAIAQQNAADIGSAGHRAGFDFAIAEECQVFHECGAYTRAYGREVIEIEYADDGGAESFRAACRARAARISIEYRDRDVVPRGGRGYLERWCGRSG
jgi:hypothetical protein